MPLEQYTQFIIEYLYRNSGLFKNMTEENREYLESAQAKQDILDFYKKGETVGGTAYFLDICY